MDSFDRAAAAHRRTKENLRRAREWLDSGRSRYDAHAAAMRALGNWWSAVAKICDVSVAVSEGFASAQADGGANVRGLRDDIRRRRLALKEVSYG